MIPFRLAFQPGVAIGQQVIYAAKKAMISGQMRPGDPFPSVRALSKAFKINPNTAHKIVTQLINERLLETLPGIGTVVAELPGSSKSERTQLLGSEIEQLVVEARKMGITLDAMLAAIRAHWNRLGTSEDAVEEEGERGGRRL